LEMVGKVELVGGGKTAKSKDFELINKILSDKSD
jgi:hypothetical protein